MNHNLFKEFAVDRDAISTNRGFYYQYLHLLKRWLEIYLSDKTDDLYTEVGDDIKQVGDKLVFTQVKCYSSSFSLNSKEVKTALYHFFMLFLEERDSPLTKKFIFETNTRLATNEKLLRQWIEHLTNLDNELHEKCARRVQNIVIGELKRIRNAKLSKSNISFQRKDAINSSFTYLQDFLSNEIFLAFTRTISWNFSDVPPDNAIQRTYNEIQLLLSDPKFGGKSSTLLFNVLISEIYSASSESLPENRKLNASKLYSILTNTEIELQKGVNQAFLSLVQSQLSISNEIEQIQKVQGNHDVRIERVERELNCNINKKVVKPKFLTALPFINTSHTFGRSMDIEHINKVLQNSNHISLNGSGGMGKTTLARLYAYQLEDRYSHIIWLDASGGIDNAIVLNEELFSNLGLDLPQAQTLQTTLTKIKIALEELDGKNLIIINDYIENRDKINSYLSLKNWDTIVTTRLIISGLTSYKIQQLEFEAAKQLYTAADASATDELLSKFFKMIDGNTLLIELTSKTIRNSVDLTLEKFINFFLEQKLDDENLLVDIEIDGKDEFIRLYPFLEQTFALSTLTDYDMFLLNFMAVLPSEDIRISDLVAICGKEFESKNNIEFANAATRLAKTGWIERTNDIIKIHRVLQELIIYRQRRDRNGFSPNMLFISWLIARFKEGFEKNQTYSMRFLKYGESILNKIKEQYRESIYQPLLALENEVLNVYRWITPDLPKERWKDLKARAEKYLEGKDPLLGVIYNNYGLSTANTDEETSEVYFKKSIAILTDKENYARSLLAALNNLCMLYVQKKDFANFKEITNIIIDFIQKDKEINDSDLAASCNVLGMANQRFGNFKPAIKLFSLAVNLHLESPKDKRNEIHLVVYLNNLAFNLFIDGDREKAIACQTKALNIIKSNQLFANWIFRRTCKILIAMLREIGEIEKAKDLMAYMSSKNTEACNNMSSDD